MRKYVGSNTLSGDLEWNATLLEGDLEDSIPKLKDEVDADLFMHGSGDFAYALAEKGLIDEYEVYLNPLVWGEGNVHVLGDRGTVRMKLDVSGSTPELSSSPTSRRLDRGWPRGDPARATENRSPRAGAKFVVAAATKGCVYPRLRSSDSTLVQPRQLSHASSRSTTSSVPRRAHERIRAPRPREGNRTSSTHESTRRCRSQPGRKADGLPPAARTPVGHAWRCRGPNLHGRSNR
jgi:RibD C-terminal domain